MSNQYKSPLLASIHENMQDCYRNGAITQTTMREFDALCLEPASEMSGEDIRNLRRRENLSQPVFASYLNVTKTTVSEWERGVKKPGGPALRLLSLINARGIEIFSPVQA